MSHLANVSTVCVCVRAPLSFSKCEWSISVCVHVCSYDFFKRVSGDNQPPAHRTKRPGQSFKEKLCISHPWITAMKWALVTQPESMKRASEGSRHCRPSLYCPNGCLFSLPQLWRASREKGVEWWRALSALPTQQPLSAMKAQVMSPVQRDKISKNTNLAVSVCGFCACVCESCYIYY